VTRCTNCNLPLNRPTDRNAEGASLRRRRDLSSTRAQLLGFSRRWWRSGDVRAPMFDPLCSITAQGVQCGVSPYRKRRVADPCQARKSKILRIMLLARRSTNACLVRCYLGIEAVSAAWTDRRLLQRGGASRGSAAPKMRNAGAARSNRARTTGKHSQALDRGLGTHSRRPETKTGGTLTET
jgi:hypothetical protein